ncbi:YpoC family protein [Paenisporosarcina sp. NPDC076898]|uniref:YpoC family protein n=1 Tax=unclassified Paenisporosarcina TaxID=2642018 RepID=UPI003D087A64
MIRFDPTHAKKEDLSELFNQWSTLKETIQDAFKVKNSETHQQMKNGIKLYQELLLQVSESNNFDPEELKYYEILPLNGQERYTFIVMNSNRYSAFCQLNELFDETNKKIARLRIKAT